MKKKKFSTKLKESKQPRKQRRYNYSAPLHIKQKFVNVHISKELRKKYNKRSVGLKKGDSVKILRGKFKGHTGTVEKINLKKSKAIINGAEFTKKDGSKLPFLIAVSNLIITELNIEDKKRRKSIERKSK